MKEAEMTRATALTARGRIALGMAALLLTVSPVLASLARADDTPEERTTLKGIKAVKVVVRDLHPDAEADGLTAGQLLGDVQARLRKAGVPTSPSAATSLNVTVNTSGRENGWYYFVIEVSLTQPVALVRDRKGIILAATWRMGNFGDVAAQDLVRFVRETVAGHVDRFIRAYREQNPTQ
jgi:hypothetical protein